MSESELGMTLLRHLEASGAKVFEAGGHVFRRSGPALMPASPIPTFPTLSFEDERKLLRNSGAHLLRYTTGRVDRPGDWWWMVCRKYEESLLATKTAKEIRRAHRKCEVRGVSAEWLATHGYACYRSAFDRYAGANPVSEEEFRADISVHAEPLYQHWAVFFEGHLAGYAACIVEPTGVALSSLKLNPEFLKQLTSYALLDAMLTHYVREKHLPLSNGQRSVAHDTNMQGFLEKFCFEKEYCRLRVVYTPLLAFLVRILFPFRRLVMKVPRLNALSILLRQEEFARGS